ncbi:MAG: flagellar basal body L-ring protein FlgH [Magnetococcales bacterium]|nr:flagellar basal body L-ring protein FlgH [Magnetococcales bacterium]
MNGLAKMILLLPVLPIAVSGCGMTRATERPPAPIAVVQPTPPESLTPKKGSIWQTTDRNTLFLDNKARNIGDLIAVIISESSSAVSDANTKLEHTGSKTVGLTGTSGSAGSNNIGKLLNSTLGTGGVAATLGGTNDSTLSGKGKTDRKSELKAKISCVVTQVLPNGNLRIEGRRDITVNHENQFIILSGVVRPEDISADNSVTSDQIADARIDYSGDGDIDDQQRPGWFDRFFSTINVL